jgi:predicted transcriptional regulator
MKAFEWIDRVKSERGIASDYAAAKLLGISKQAISTYRAKGSTLDEEASIVIAKELGISPAGVVLDQTAERTKTPEIRAALLEEAAKICMRSVYYVK